MVILLLANQNLTPMLLIARIHEFSDDVPRDVRSIQKVGAHIFKGQTDKQKKVMLLAARSTYIVVKGGRDMWPLCLPSSYVHERTAQLLFGI